MINTEAIRGLHVVTDYNAVEQAPVPRDLVEAVGMVLEGGARVIQIRHKEGTTAQRVALGVKLKPLTRRYQALLLYNDDLEAALAVVDGKPIADGLHIGRDDGDLSQMRKAIGPNRILGFSAENEDEVREAEKWADYFGVTVYRSKRTKPDAKPVGLDGIRRLRAVTRKPLVAIGGMDLTTITEAITAGADTAAVVGAALRRTNPEMATRELTRRIPIYNR